MNETDIFISRIQLLIIMAKAFLKGMPHGKHRREAVLKNAEEVFYTSLLLANREAGQENPLNELINQQGGAAVDRHIFFQRVQLLSIMAKAIAEDRLAGDYKLKALEENVGFICSAVTLQEQLPEMEFLKVA